MKCYCCDKQLSDKEIIYNDDLSNFELCTFCLDIALDAAYSNGFSIEDTETPLLDLDWDNYGDDLLPNQNTRWPY